MVKAEGKKTMSFRIPERLHRELRIEKAKSSLKSLEEFTECIIRLGLERYKGAR